MCNSLCRSTRKRTAVRVLQRRLPRRRVELHRKEKVLLDAYSVLEGDGAGV